MGRQTTMLKKFPRNLALLSTGIAIVLIGAACHPFGEESTEGEISQRLTSRCSSAPTVAATLSLEGTLPKGGQGLLVTNRVLPSLPRSVDFAAFRREGHNNIFRGVKDLSPTPTATNWVLGSHTPMGMKPSVGWVFLNQWYSLGPFFYTNVHLAVTQVFPPELAFGCDEDPIELDFSDPHCGVRKTDWAALEWETVTSTNRCVRLAPTGTPKGVWYTYTEVYSPTSRDVWCQYGAYGWIGVWVNAELTFVSSTRPDCIYPMGAGSGTVHLQEGYNRVFCKVVTPWFPEQDVPAFSMGLFRGEFQLGSGAATRLSY